MANFVIDRTFPRGTPDNTGVLWKAATDFAIIGQRWPAIEAWASGTTRARRRLDPRSVFYFDDAGWMGAAPTPIPVVTLTGGWAAQGPILTRGRPRMTASGAYHGPRIP